MFLTVWLTIVILYVRIGKEARIHAKRSKQNNFDDPTSNNGKSNQVVLLILGSFTICWLPYVIVAVLQVIDLPKRDKSTSTLYHLMFWMAMCNSGVNPLIYAWKNSSFRKAFKRLLKFKSPNCNDYNTSFINYLKKQNELKKRERDREACSEFKPVVFLRTISARIDKEEAVF